MVIIGMYNCCVLNGWVYQYIPNIPCLSPLKRLMLIEAINFQCSICTLLQPYLLIRKDEWCLKTNNCFGFRIVVIVEKETQLFSRGDNFVFNIFSLFFTVVIFYTIETLTLAKITSVSNSTLYATLIEQQETN